MRLVRALLMLLFLLSVACDRRPTESEAAAQFRRIYPGVQLVEVSIREDEVVARSFEFRYRTSAGSVRSIDLQFVEAPDGRWIPQPAAPKSLPGTQSSVPLAAHAQISTPASARTPSVSGSVPSADTDASKPLRVGGDVKAPVVIHRVEPAYPHPGGQFTLGIVILEAVITTDGRVRDLRVIKGPGNEFEAAIVTAVKQWHFKPATLHGEPVEVIYNVLVHHVPYARVAA